MGTGGQNVHSCFFSSDFYVGARCHNNSFLFTLSLIKIPLKEIFSRTSHKKCSFKIT